MNLLDIEGETEGDFCSQFSRLSLIYRFYPLTLDQVFKEKRKRKEKFTENEVFNLIENVTTALLALNSSLINHSDIRPKTILLSPEGSFKITDI